MRGDLAKTPDEYVAERNIALLDFSTFVPFAAKYGIRYSSPMSAEISFHKLRTAARSLPHHLRKQSHDWLVERNYQPWDDGDLR